MLAVLDETSCAGSWPGCSTRTISRPHGLRALSRYHGEHPFRFDVHGQTYEVRYLPAESDSGMFGGNSNWRGPVWFPVNYLILRGLMHLYAYYGDEFTWSAPPARAASAPCSRSPPSWAAAVSIFLPDANGRRPVYGGTERFQ